MSPDFDDYDDVPTERDEYERPRTLPRLVLALAIVGFIALAIYAYRSGKDAVQPGDLATIEADLSAIKERPADPEGEEFPHKDKTIYDAISPYKAAEAPKVEKLLPEPEEPVKPATETADAKTWVNESIRQQDTERAPPAPTPEAPVEEPKPTAETKPQQEPKPAPKPEPAPVAPKEEPKPVAKPATPAPAAASGAYKIQLGAFKSEKEAVDTWNKIVAKHSDVLSGKSRVIVKADLSNGTFYRLRASGYATADAAKSACTTLSARKQGCFYAGR